ncbi:Beta-glucosidase BoGH3B [Bienertia sinuspersici]
MVPYNYTEFISNLTSLVKANHIPMSRIDDVVKRILRVKFHMGLVEHPVADTSLTHQLGSQVCTTPNKVARFSLLIVARFWLNKEMQDKNG